MYMDKKAVMKYRVGDKVVLKDTITYNEDIENVLKKTDRIVTIMGIGQSVGDIFPGYFMGDGLDGYLFDEYAISGLADVLTIETEKERDSLIKTTMNTIEELTVVLESETGATNNELEALVQLTEITRKLLVDKDHE